MAGILLIHIESERGGGNNFHPPHFHAINNKSGAKKLRKKCLAVE
jgi:hypothetical protein